MSYILITLIVWLCANVIILSIGLIFFIWSMPKPDRSFVGRGLVWNRKLKQYEAARGTK